MESVANCYSSDCLSAKRKNALRLKGFLLEPILNLRSKSETRQKWSVVTIFGSVVATKQKPVTGNVGYKDWEQLGILY